MAAQLPNRAEDMSALRKSGNLGGARGPARTSQRGTVGHAVMDSVLPCVMYCPSTVPTQHIGRKRFATQANLSFSAHFMTENHFLLMRKLSSGIAYLSKNKNKSFCKVLCQCASREWTDKKFYIMHARQTWLPRDMGRHDAGSEALGTRPREWEALLGA